MELLTRQMAANSAAKRWKQQYFTKRNNKWVTTVSGDCEVTYKKLIALNPVTPEGVDQIIGNSSWTKLTCHECGKDQDTVVQVGQTPDYDSYTACLCVECVQKAFVLITGN